MPSRSKCKIIVFFGVILFFISAFQCLGQQDPPPDTASTVFFANNELVLIYEGHAILRAHVTLAEDKYRWNSLVERKNGALSQVIVFTSEDWNTKLIMAGEITGSRESFPCEADRRPRGPDVVRHSYGLSNSLLNRALYDRNRDWVLSFDYYADVRITPVLSSGGPLRFQFEAKGNEIIIRFRPHYYQKHRRLEYFEPWTYSVWKKPVVGWCSWFAYFRDISESNVKHVADVLSEKLLPFGYEYLQIDDGYQRGQGLPELWLQPNEKFPGGLQSLSDYIHSKGLKSGIWTNVAFDQAEYAKEHRKWFVLDSDNNPAIGNWINLSIDGSEKGAIDTLVRPIYQGLREMGWDYFKVDALRHLRYEGYNSNPAYFKRKNIDRVEAYRQLVMGIRQEIGRGNYMLGCWGIRPELAGIIDGCRIGDDGFSYAGLAQYNSFNNVVWRNDPDHIELSLKEAYRSTMVTSLTGSVLMLTDKPDRYGTNVIEAAKRASPVLFTLPGQIFDVDPSRSEMLEGAGAEVSGSGPRPFDAGYVPRCELYLLEINKDYENWMMLGRTGGDYKKISFSDLGLSQEKEYFVFEFWSKRWLGSFSKEFNPGKIDTQFNCQLFCIRQKMPHPQLIATSRHISCGGYEIKSISWEDSVLRGESSLVGGDPYDIYITEPEGYTYLNIACQGAEATGTESKGMLRVFHLVSRSRGAVSWQIDFEKRKK